MKSRRSFLKTAGTLVVAAPIIGLPSIALAEGISGRTTLKGIDQKTLRGPGLKRWLEDWINRRIKASKNPEEAFSQLKENRKQFDAELNRVVKQIQSKELPDEIKDKPAGIKIKFSFEFPPAKFKIEVSF